MTNNDPSPPNAVSRGFAFSQERRSAFLGLAIQNFEVGRQNLHGTQFSSNAKLVAFYEGIALGCNACQMGRSLSQRGGGFSWWPPDSWIAQNQKAKRLRDW